MRHLLAAAFLSCLAAATFAEDWPQWRGPTRDGISTEKNLIAELPDNPKILWQTKVGKGYSTVAVANGKAYTQGTDKGKESIICFDAEKGTELWRYTTSRADAESANTPAIADGKVYALARAGDLLCLDAETGKLIWSKDASKDLGGSKPQYQFACSPLILGDNVIFDVGSNVAISRKSGEVLWKTGGGNPSYGSPVPFKSGNDTLLATFKPSGLVVINSKDGSNVASYNWKTSYDVNAATPIVSGNSIFISSGYGHGCAKVDLNGDKLVKAYETKDMQNQYTTSVLVDGFVYGLSDGHKLVCVNLATGKTVWSQKDLGAGGLIYADGKLIMMCDQGILEMAEANPKAYKSLGSAQILKGQCWTAPTLSNGKVYVRNTDGVVMCVDFRK